MAIELEKIKPTIDHVKPIQKQEFEERVKKAVELMKKDGIQATYVHAGTNLYYFTGTRWSSSERMVGALILLNGTVHYIAPQFELGTILDFRLVEGEIHCWEEHESPFELLFAILKAEDINAGKLAIDETTPFFISDGLQKVSGSFTIVNAKSITAGCRMIKSKNEIAIMQAAMDITMEVQKAVARILYPGISAQEVVGFIEKAHQAYGTTGSYFCIVLFGVDTSFPHGVKHPKNLKEGDVVLIDTGCVLHDYISDITRTYVYGIPNEEQRRIWDIEKATQLAAFEAAKLNMTFGSIDDASRKEIGRNGLSTDYSLPGLPHRTGHGIGLDIHEWPYVVKDSQEQIKEGMTFSIEPMICVPNKFGIRLEDHIYMANEGPKWFTKPAHSIENPFVI